MYSQDAVNYDNNFLSNILITVNFIVTSQLPYPFINKINIELGDIIYSKNLSTYNFIKNSIQKLIYMIELRYNITI